jgi:chromosome segregation ATPase
MPNPQDDELTTRVANLEREVARLSALEHEVARFREQLPLAINDAAAARVMAAGADHDVSEVRAELRAHTTVLNALRETQLEQGTEISQLRDEVGQLRDETGHIRHTLGDLSTGQAHIVALLGQIIDQQPKEGQPNEGTPPG